MNKTKLLFVTLFILLLTGCGKKNYNVLMLPDNQEIKISSDFETIDSEEELKENTNKDFPVMYKGKSVEISGIDFNIYADKNSNNQASIYYESNYSDANKTKIDNFLEKNYKDDSNEVIEISGEKAYVLIIDDEAWVIRCFKTDIDTLRIIIGRNTEYDN